MDTLPSSFHPTIQSIVNSKCTSIFWKYSPFTVLLNIFQSFPSCGTSTKHLWNPDKLCGEFTFPSLLTDFDARWSWHGKGTEKTESSGFWKVVLKSFLFLRQPLRYYADRNLGFNWISRTLRMFAQMSDRTETLNQSSLRVVFEL